MRKHTDSDNNTFIAVGIHGLRWGRRTRRRNGLRSESLPCAYLEEHELKFHFCTTEVRTRCLSMNTVTDTEATISPNAVMAVHAICVAIYVDYLKVSSWSLRGKIVAYLPSQSLAGITVGKRDTRGYEGAEVRRDEDGSNWRKRTNWYTSNHVQEGRIWK